MGLIELRSHGRRWSKCGGEMGCRLFREETRVWKCTSESALGRLMVSRRGRLGL